MYLSRYIVCSSVLCGLSMLLIMKVVLFCLLESVRFIVLSISGWFSCSSGSFLCVSVRL